ncbi:5861_t:CDS:2 [Paraglomus occultum]|uniref:5861_t:CDS:1 n=1 Tax=Paraglomus occultum TaxID=144539 RepID=A0A9N9FRT1_9GLOM|nr:5861_t:CDS:2 [Paraglomus occultum]
MKERSQESSASEESLAEPGLDVAEPGVVYVGRIPHGFYEKEMREYFSQFGKINKLKLSRNKKTGKSRHFAFIEFESAEVAQIVAETMNNYLLHNHLLQCNVVPKDKVHPMIWCGLGKKIKPGLAIKVAANKFNRRRSAKEISDMANRLIRKDNKRREKMKELGINYEFSGYSQSS